jgi:hypothetical protein
LWFAIQEGWALADKDRGDTLSEHVWAWFHIRDARPTPLVWAGRAFLIIGAVWLGGHFAFGIWSF